MCVCINKYVAAATTQKDIFSTCMYRRKRERKKRRVRRMYGAAFGEIGPRTTCGLRCKAQPRSGKEASAAPHTEVSARSIAVRFRDDEIDEAKKWRRSYYRASFLGSFFGPKIGGPILIGTRVNERTDRECNFHSLISSVDEIGATL